MIKNNKYMELYEMLMAKSHDDILEIVSRVKSGYAVVNGSKWTLFIPEQVTCDVIPMMVSHTDTVSNKKPKKFKSFGNVVTNPDGVLGADDRAGCYGLYKMMEANVQAFYLFTDEEEIGGVGASEFAMSDTWEEIQESVSGLVELDRRGSSDVATYGYDNSEFVKLFERHGYKEANGSYTDVVSLSEKSTLACVNLSIGYYDEHSQSERLNIAEMQDTIDLMVTLEEQIPALYENRYESETTPYNYWEDDIEDEGAILCDVCESHKPLFDTSWGYVCAECKEIDEYKYA